ncbi:hypothetical protein BDR05DRAFT_970876 [Suillus weaverae]|nr:hypothetical protein BDR05DRAFT_970876 [Suillus weaverae]
MLIVHCPSLGHEILPELFDVMRYAGTSYPKTYHGSKITQGGSTTIDLAAGSKSPDFSLYEVKEGGGKVQKAESEVPTIAFEVGYYGEGEKKLALDAGRLICLSKGMIQLRNLKSVIWTHWEMDPLYPNHVAKNAAYKLNKLVPERDGVLVTDTETVQPTPDAYQAVVSFGKTPYWVRAYKSNTYKLFPDQGVKSIPILHRHLFRDPQEGDQNDPAFAIQTVDIMATIHSHEDKTAGDMDGIDKKLLERLKKRRVN